VPAYFSRTGVRAVSPCSQCSGQQGSWLGNTSCNEATASSRLLPCCCAAKRQRPLLVSPQKWQGQASPYRGRIAAKLWMVPRPCCPCLVAPGTFVYMVCCHCMLSSVCVCLQGKDFTLYSKTVGMVKFRREDVVLAGRANHSTKSRRVLCCHSN
jgi:hypothetical protein